MRPEQLTLVNIGPFQGTHRIDFSVLGDIFLIFGKTGAGKTTLFDALSYAFYGDVPGARSGNPRSMRSHFALDGEESSVELIFSLSGKKYRITRIPPNEKIGVRSGKIQAVPEEAALDEWRDGGWMSRTSTNKSDTDKSILSLIGLSAEEFSRIVLLPQGEFARFLRQNSAERKEVLSKLFPVDSYARVIEIARSRARDAAAALKETEQNLASLRKEEDALPEGRSKEQAAEALASLRIARDDLRRQYASRSETVAEARAASERKRRIGELEEEKKLLDSRKDLLDGLAARVRSSRKARPLAETADRLDGEKKKGTEREREIAETEKELIKTAEILSGLEGREAETARLAAEREELALKKERLRIAIDIAEKIEESGASLSEMKTALAQAKKDEEAQKTVLDDITEKLALLEKDAGNLDRYAQELQDARDALEETRRANAHAEDCERERKAASAHQAAYEKVLAELETAQRDAEIARAELDDLREGARRAERESAAEQLAENLAPGMPCPVCGSLEHPAPAAKKAAAIPWAERIAAGERRLEALRKKLTELQRETAAREAGMKAARERLGELLPGNASCAALPAPEEAAKLLADAVTRANAAAERAGKARAAWRESEALRQKREAAQREAERIGARKTDINARAAEAKAALEAARGRWKEAGLEEGTDAGEAFEQCASRMLEIEQEISSRRERLENAGKRKTSLEATREALKKAMEESLPEIKRLETDFAAAAAAAGFPDGEAVRNALLSHEEEEQADREIAAWNEKRHSLDGSLERLKTEHSLWKGPSEAEALAALGETEQAMREADRELEKTTAALAALENLERRRSVLEAERAERSLTAGRLQSLSDDLSGNNPARVSFDAWILGMYLEEITAYANLRLERMSEGRYRIQLNGSYRRGNALSGLELEIVDAWTGKARPSATLSGGETFMASISLALGLADSIQSRSGGIQLDAIFIDEGFGSLDESSLERAVTILDEIRGSRMVGIISHVSELRTRIPARVEIVKTGTGSRIEQGEPE